MPEVALGDRDHQAKVRLRELALGLAEPGVGRLDLVEERAELAPAQSGLAREFAALARKGGRSVLARFHGDLLASFGEPTGLRHQAVNHRGLQRQPDDDRLDGLTVGANPPGVVPPGRGRQSPVAQAFLEPHDLRRRGVGRGRTSAELA